MDIKAKFYAGSEQKPMPPSLPMREAPQRVKVENKLLHTHGAGAPDVGGAVSNMETSVRTLAEANRKGKKFHSLAAKFYPPENDKPIMDTNA